MIKYQIYWSNADTCFISFVSLISFWNKVAFQIMINHNLLLLTLHQALIDTGSPSGPPVCPVRWVEPIPKRVSGAFKQVSGKRKDNPGENWNMKVIFDESCKFW